jgi:hypothetical protein
MQIFLLSILFSLSVYLSLPLPCSAPLFMIKWFSLILYLPFQKFEAGCSFFPQPVVTSTISVLNIIQVCICQEAAVGVLSLFQYYRAIQAHICPTYAICVLFRKDQESTYKTSFQKTRGGSMPHPQWLAYGLSLWNISELPWMDQLQDPMSHFSPWTLWAISYFEPKVLQEVGTRSTFLWVAYW